MQQHANARLGLSSRYALAGRAASRTPRPRTRLSRMQALYDDSGPYVPVRCFPRKHAFIERNRTLSDTTTGKQLRATAQGRVSASLEGRQHRLREYRGIPRDDGAPWQACEKLGQIANGDGHDGRHAGERLLDRNG